MSDGTCLTDHRLSLLPACAKGLSVCHHPSCLQTALLFQLGVWESRPIQDTAKSGRRQPAPQGSSLRSGLFCPSPSSLNRPHPPHSQARPDFAALRLIPSAFAVRERLSDPRAVPSFRCLLFSDMSPSMIPEVPVAAFIQFLRHRRWPSLGSERSAPSKLPPSASGGARDFGTSWFASAATYQIARLPLADLTGSPQPQETFTSGLSTIRSPSSSPDITTAATGQLPPVGLSPTRTAASFAAPDPSVHV